MSHTSSPKRKILDAVILLVLVGIAGFQIITRLPKGGSSERSAEDDLLLMGLDAEPTRIPGRTVMGERGHDMLTDAVSARRDQMSDLELTGLLPGTEPVPEPEPTSRPADPAPDEPSETAVIPPVEDPPVAVPDEPHRELVLTGPEDDLPGLPPADNGALPAEPEPEPEASSTEGIWVQSSRTGGNPIRVEDHVSVNADQLAEMAGYRNISTDIRFSAPRFTVSAVGTGRLGTYVIVDSQMIRLNGQINSPSSPPRAWRLHEVTGNEIYWVPVD
jgi:hypothetical protein